MDKKKNSYYSSEFFLESDLKDSEDMKSPVNTQRTAESGRYLIRCPGEIEKNNRFSCKVGIFI